MVCYNSIIFQLFAMSLANQAEFSLPTMSQVLPSTVYQNHLRRIQADEIKVRLRAIHTLAHAHVQILPHAHSRLHGWRAWSLV
jgi:hypothetical protein